MGTFKRSVQRTRAEVIKILESALIANGDDAFDDFVSIPIADPVLEAIRRQCKDVVFAATDVFGATLSSATAELKASASRSKT